MKNVKKVLALMLAITMMFGVVSICASAANTTTASFKITYKDANGEVIDSAKAGDTIDVFIAIKTDGYAPNFYIQSFYDVTLLTQVSTSSAAFDKNTAYEAQGRFTQTGVVDAANGGNGEALDWGTGTFNSALHNKRMYPKTWTDAEKAQYQGFVVGWKAPASAGSIVTVNTQNQFEDFAKLRFTVIADTALNDSTFKFEKSMTYVNIDPDDVAVNIEQTSSPVKVTGDSLNIEYASAGGSTPAPQMTIVNASTQVQWQDEAAGKIRLGFRGNVQNLVPDFVEGSTKDITNIKCMGIVYSTAVENPTVKNEVKSSTTEDGKTVYYCEASDNCTNVPTYTLYDFTSGGYFFRAVVGSVDKASETKFYANAYIVLPDDTIVYATNGATSTTGKAQYDRLVAALANKNA